MKRRRKDGLGLFLVLLGLYAAVFGLRALYRGFVRGVTLEPEKSVYFHDDIIRLVLRTRDPDLKRLWRTSPPRAVVSRRGEVLTTVAGIREAPFWPDPVTDEWTARWPCPWNAEATEYTVDLADGGGAWRERLSRKAFRVARRKPLPLPKGLAVLTLESVSPFRSLAVPTPSGGLKDWRGLLDWVEHTGADALWVLGGQTPGDKPGELWMSQNQGMIPVLAKECRRRGIKFGVYVMCYLTMSKERLPRYEYAREVKDGKTVFTRAISLREDRRVADVTALLKTWHDIPEVDYVGVDYIRNALGGYELAEDFYREMPGVQPPANWSKLSAEERMVWFARKKVMRKDREFIDAWQWWRAHKVAGIVRRIKAELGDSKPFWAFTLTWDKGWHHGQDPVMMNDAGVDADALMLYEATAEQYDGLLKAWNRYVRRGDVQLVVGDVVDWGLHQKSPDGPREFTRRSIAAIDRIYSDGPAYGVFVHDLGRAFWGRTGPWGTRGWMEEAAKVVRHMKSVSGVRGAPPPGPVITRRRRKAAPEAAPEPAPEAAPEPAPAPARAAEPPEDASTLAPSPEPVDGQPPPGSGGAPPASPPAAPPEAAPASGEEFK